MAINETEPSACPVSGAGGAEEQKERLRITMNRHASTYRTDFEKNTDELHARCPIAWNDTHDGYWYVSGNQELMDTARRADVLSNDADIHQQRRGYKGINIPGPPPEGRTTIGGFLEMDPPEQRHYRQALNPYLSPAAVQRWQPVLDELTRACVDEKIESGQIDFVDDLANIVPAVFTMAILGFPLKDWVVYCEPAHASVYTSPDDPDHARVMDMAMKMGVRAFESIAEIKQTRKPGLADALIRADINGHQPDDMDLIGAVMLLIGGGFDTTTALTAHSLEWLSQHPEERDRLSRERETLLDSATEEFLRFYTPAQGDGRTISQDVEIHGVQLREGERLWLSWAMANRDEKVFDEPHRVRLDRSGNRHASFGLGIHRCIGSNVARAAFKTMVRHVLDRMPDFVCDPAGAVHYDTTGVINGMKHLPATFTPGKRLGPGLEETIAAVQVACDEQGLAEPVTRRKDGAELDL
ncbi:cytochrome P450 [Nocardioides sp. dk4132]|uniref:cytochrome P450 n=1 Tax=unclassified Nocardioides TaxID=2615069 RepID=UPI0012950072|nr:MULTISPECIES: cytochrome P450 [unclassified Nocardioides]MQW77627.1 cytochrome P450 [Nocardioides sp. dk4132]QGA06153.1 cytochrome P450 [Nocardioides sp. dk884]